MSFALALDLGAGCLRMVGELSVGGVNLAISADWAAVWEVVPISGRCSSSSLVTDSTSLLSSSSSFFLGGPHQMYPQVGQQS